MLILTQDNKGIINTDNIAVILVDSETNGVIVDSTIGLGGVHLIIGKYDTTERAREVVREIFDCRLSRYVMPEV